MPKVERTEDDPAVWQFAETLMAVILTARHKGLTPDQAVRALFTASTATAYAYAGWSLTEFCSWFLWSADASYRGMGQLGLPAVAGDKPAISPTDLEIRARTLLAEEQEKTNPDNAIVAVLCEVTRLARWARATVPQDAQDLVLELAKEPCEAALGEARSQVDLMLSNPDALDEYVAPACAPKCMPCRARALTGRVAE